MNITYDSPLFVEYFGKTIYPLLYNLAQERNMALAEMDKLMQLAFQIAKPVFDLPDVVRDGLDGRFRKPFLQNKILRSIQARIVEFERVPSAPPQAELREPLKRKFERAQLEFMLERKRELMMNFPEMTSEAALIKVVMEWNGRCSWRP